MEEAEVMEEEEEVMEEADVNNQISHFKIPGGITLSPTATLFTSSFVEIIFPCTKNLFTIRYKYFKDLMG